MHQARFIQHHAEYYRRHKFAPCNGAHLFCFNDCWPAITWSVVDYDRERKEGFYALQRAMAPVQAFVELTESLKAGAESEAVLWVINDRPGALSDLTLAWTIVSEETEEAVGSGQVSCGIGDNGLERVGSFRWIPEESGSYRVALRLSGDGKVIAENQYMWRVEP